MKKTVFAIASAACLSLAGCASIHDSLHHHHHHAAKKADTHVAMQENALPPNLAQAPKTTEGQQIASAEEDQIDLANEIKSSAKKVRSKISSAGSAIISVLSGH